MYFADKEEIVLHCFIYGEFFNISEIFLYILIAHEKKIIFTCQNSVYTGRRTRLGLLLSLLKFFTHSKLIRGFKGLKWVKRLNH